MNLRSLFLAIVPVAFLFGLVDSAHAYIPPSGFVIRTMAQKRSGFKGFRIRSQVFAAEGDKASAPHFKETTTYDVSTRVLRSRALDDSGRELFSVERKLGDASEAQALRVDRLLFSGDSGVLVRDLKNAGVPIRTEADFHGMKDEDERRAFEVSRMLRFKGTVAWVYGGSRVPESKAAELWVEKDTFLPVKFVTRVGETWIDTTWTDYRFFKEFPYPRQIEVSKAGTPAIRAELTDLLVNPDRAEFKRVGSGGGFTDAGNAAPSSVRDLIRSYYDLVR